MKHTVINKVCIGVCNDLLKGELSAIETYRKVIGKFPSTTATAELERICAEHRLSADRLVENVAEMGGVPETDSGGWGIFAKAVQCASNLFGAESAIESLQRGEEHGHRLYLNAMDNEDVMDCCKVIIRNELLPRVDGHITTLDKLGELVD